MVQITVINQSTKITDKDATSMAKACALQIAQHVAPAWNRAAMGVVFVPKNGTIPAGSWIMSLVDDISEAPGALAYHSEDGYGRIFGRIGCGIILGEAEGTPLYDPAHPQRPTVASALSHEVCEAFMDPNVDLWADGPAIAQGSTYAFEICDPCESDQYVIRVGALPVAVSNFVTPCWFDDAPPAGSRFDYLKKINAPFTLDSGGYMVVRNGPGSEADVQDKSRAAIWTPEIVRGSEHADWRTKLKASKTARGTRRIERVTARAMNAAIPPAHFMAATEPKTP